MPRKNSDGGFSLLEMTIVLGIMSVVALGYMKLSAQKSKEEKSARVGADARELMAEIKTMIARPGYCQATFKNQLLSPGKPVVLNEIRDPLDHAVYKVGDLFKRDQIKLTGLKLEKFRFDHAEQKTGLGTLKLELEKQADVFGAKHLSHELALTFNFDSANNIDECGPLGIQEKEVVSISGIDPQQFLKNNPEEVQKALKENPELQKAMQTLDLINKQLERMDDKYE